MNEPLHPLTLAEILDRTAQIYRTRFLVFFGIGTIPAGTVFVCAAGVFAFMTWMGSRTKHGAAISDIVVWVFLIGLLLLVVPLCLGASALGEAAMSDAAARSFLGENITIRSAYQATLKRAWRYIGLYTLQGLAIFGAPSIVFLIAMFGMIAGKVRGVSSNDNSPLFGGLLFLLMLVLATGAVLILLQLCLAFPASVVEQVPAWSALKRGLSLSHGTRARIFLLYLLGVVLNQILAWCLMFPVLIAIAFIPALQGQAHAQTVGMIALLATYGSYFAVKAFIKPLFGIALTLFYFDQRIRKEGFDIEWMMQQAGMLVPPPAPESELDAVPDTLASDPPAGVEPFVEVPVALAQPESISRQAAMERALETGSA
jgi:hypothetical protein